jgi:Trypsin-like peptidase domain
MGRFQRSGMGIVLAALVLSPVAATAQEVGVPIEPERRADASPGLVARLEAMAKAGELMSLEAVGAALKNPTPVAVPLPPAATGPLSPATIAARLRKSALRVGWYYLCNNCQRWHVNSAGGYLLSSDGVGATCHHVLFRTRQEMREGYLFALDNGGKIHPITQVLAADEGLDTAIFRMADAEGLVPLAINDRTVPGDLAYLLSDPSGVSGYFSEGIINRFYWSGNKTSGDPMSLADARSLRMDVSTDWAPGSSGAPLVDACGNVVGHVSSISAIMSQPVDPPAHATNGARDPSRASSTMRSESMPSTQIVLHEAIPIRCARLLIEAMNDASNRRAMAVADGKKD